MRNKLAYLVTITFGILLTLTLTLYWGSRPNLVVDPEYVHEEETVEFFKTPVRFMKEEPHNIFFSPRGGCEEIICSLIKEAKEEIYVAIYVLTSKAITQELVNAKVKGVKVWVIADYKQAHTSYSTVSQLVRSGVEVFLDKKHAIFHNKFIILDGQKVLTGSYNFTNAAQNSNAENLIIFKEEATASKYIENWKLHRAHCVIPKF